MAFKNSNTPIGVLPVNQEKHFFQATKNWNWNSARFNK
jgi:hypothetical protein